MTGSWNKNVHTKVCFKGSVMTGSWNKNVHSKVSYKGSTRWRDRGIKMFIVQYLLKAAR